MASKPPDHTLYRSAKTGEFVTEEFAKSHRATTEREHRPARTPTPPPKKNK
jgi:hypothetical protein